ncbi:MAG: WD40 repeat domain-containing protein [Synechococcales bacterium]|nr:WD40 repeat domain-containing protein [Synechococcales bacterium]
MSDLEANSPARRRNRKISPPQFQRMGQGQLAQTSLTDYVTAIAWSQTGSLGSATSAAGELLLWDLSTEQITLLQPAGAYSLDCLAFSQDGNYLATAGQQGQVFVWQLQPQPLLIQTIDCAGVWIDRLRWHPTQPLLTLSVGKSVQVWNLETRSQEVTLPFAASSVLDVSWDPQGERLAIAGYQGVKIWYRQDWTADPYWLEMPSASLAIAWSGDGNYLASGNFDRTVTVIEGENPDRPWVMRGFPGKVRKLAWSDPISPATGAPVLASVSAEGIVLWQRHGEDAIGWEGEVAGLHTGTVLDVAFQPQSLTWASASEDGQVQIYYHLNQPIQLLSGAPQGFTKLAWHPTGDFLATGGRQGELLIWTQNHLS